MDDTRCLKTVDRLGVDDALTTLFVFQEFTPSSLDEYPQPVASVAKEQLDLGCISFDKFNFQTLIRTSNFARIV